MKRTFLLGVIITLSLSIFAIDEVTLTTIGEGSTRDEAVKSAWRSALEQAYGAFMSSSSISVDDELQKDEIVSITSGNIKNYKVLGEATREDGMIVTSCVVTVSLTKLLDYMQSTGAEVAFSGASFAANIQLEELNRKSEQKAIEHLIDALSNMKGLCDYELKLNEPQVEGNRCVVKGKIFFMFNAQSINFNILLYNTLSQLHTQNGKNDVPNLGNFKLRNPLPSVLKNDLTMYNNMEYDYYRYYQGGNSSNFGNPYAIRDRFPIGKFVFFYDIMLFAIYDNLHPNIEKTSDLTVSYGSLHSSYGFIDGREPISYLPYACVPVEYKKGYNNANSDYYSGYTITRPDGKYYMVRPPKTNSKSNGADAWWELLANNFVYPSRTHELAMCDTYAQIGERFAWMDVTITIPMNDIAKYTNFGIRYDSNYDIQRKKAEQERIKAEQEKQQKEQERIKAQQEQAAKEKAYVDSLKNTYAKIQRGGQDVKKGINSPEAQYVYKQIVLLKDTSKYMGLIADTIAMCYNKGYGVERNQDVAADWLWKAAQHGNSDAMETVGYAYLYQLTWYSRYCSVNPKKAYHWLGKAIKLNPNDENLKKAYSKAQKIVSVMNKYGNAKMSWKIERRGSYPCNDRYLILDVYKKMKNGDMEHEYYSTVLEEKLYYSGDSGTWLY